MDAAAVARRVVIADRPPHPVGPLDREDVPVVRDAAVGASDRRGGGGRSADNENQGEEEEALQWCSITRSTMLYSFASSALIK